jgi:hypothetical protein
MPRQPALESSWSTAISTVTSNRAPETDGRRVRRDHCVALPGAPQPQTWRVWRGRHLGRNVDFLEGDAEHLPFEDTLFDTVVCALSL